MINNKKSLENWNNLSVREVYKLARNELPSAISLASLRLLLADHLNCHNLAEIDLRLDENMPSGEFFHHKFLRLLKGEPVQYIDERADFLGHSFYVDPRVLIPREETEELTDKIIRDLKDIYPSGRFRLVDIGTGSGAIAISLALAYPQAEIWAGDIDPDALVVARKNARKLGANVTFFEGDVLAPLAKDNLRFDVFVANPPYIVSPDHVDAQVLAYEPHLALFAKDHGLAIYKTIVDQAENFLGQQSRFYFEIGAEQKESLRQITLAKYPLADISFQKDMQGNDRIMTIILPERK